jgi:protein phosphatase 1 regulatory subunit 7
MPLAGCSSLGLALIGNVCCVMFRVLQRICLRQNLIIDITGFDSLKELNELDLYDNKISHIRGLDALTELRYCLH